MTPKNSVSKQAKQTTKASVSKTRKNEPTVSASKARPRSPTTFTTEKKAAIARAALIQSLKTDDSQKQVQKIADELQRPKRIVARRNSIMNLTRLTLDGRKKPEHYRKLALEANSPSQLSFKSITEFYEPSYEFYNVDDVYNYRGYKKLSRIDEGAFGIVHKAVRLSDRKQVALKEVDLSKRRNKRIEETKRELYVLQKIDSPYVVKLIEHFVAGSTLVIIMELCQGSNITSYLKDTALEEDEVKFFFRQMVTGIRIMHRMGIAHRDVKLNNFLLDGSLKQVKVADFGLSVVSFKPNKTLQLCKTYCGTEPYMAPEIIRRNSKGFRQYNPYYADVWALGVCLYAMLTRTFPFKVNLTQRGLYRHQRERRWKIPRVMRDKISDELTDLIWHMLDPEQDRRISINGVATHPWFNPDAVVLTAEES